MFQGSEDTTAYAKKNNLIKETSFVEEIIENINLPSNIMTNTLKCGDRQSIIDQNSFNNIKKTSNLFFEPQIKKTFQSFQCRFCTNRYGTEPALLSHTVQKHPPKYLCHFCDSSFSSEVCYKDHLALHMYKHEKFCCHKCGFKSRSFINEEHVCNFQCVMCISCGKEKYIEPGYNGQNLFKCEECLNAEFLVGGDEQLNIMVQDSLLNPQTLNSNYQVTFLVLDIFLIDLMSNLKWSTSCKLFNNVISWPYHLPLPIKIFKSYGNNILNVLDAL